MLHSPAGAEPPRQTTRNPISLRLYKVLGTNYGDPSTRDALLSISKFYSTQPAAGDGGDQTKHGELAARARKNLRRDLDNRLADGSQQFLRAFQGVDEKLRTLDLLVADMHSNCNEAEAQLQVTNEVCNSLLARAASLRAERNVVQSKQSIISLFLQRFTLSPDEISALTSREIPVGRSMFRAIERTEKIREDCALLLQADDEDSKAGLDIMSQTSAYIDQGYYKLQRYCTAEFRRPAGDMQLEVSSDLQTAIRYLKKRPDLLQEVLSTLAESRRLALLQSFMTALTRGGPDGMPRPIEFHAHDPVRYVGDMLAWVHQAIAWENEYFESLFSVDTKTRMMGSVRVFPSLADAENSEEQWLSNLMDSDVEGLCKPLKLRISQTIKSQEGGVTAYKIRNLIHFYQITLKRTIGENATLSRLLLELANLAHSTFIASLQGQGRSLLRFLHPPDSDMAPPLALIDAAQLLKEMMTVYESSAVEEESQDALVDGFKDILDASIEPVIEMCHRMASLLASKDGERDAWDRNIFLANCFAYLQAILQPYQFTRERVSLLEQSVRQCVDGLIEQHCRVMLSDSGLNVLTQAIENKAKDVPLSHTAPPQVVSQSLLRFSEFLSSLDVLSSPRLALLTAPQLSYLVHREALRKISDAYSSICSSIKDPTNKYEFVSTLLGSQRPFGQLRTLFQILGLEDTA